MSPASKRLALAPHADRDRGAAYCTFNDLVGAARAMAADMERPVAIVDLDAHPADTIYNVRMNSAN